jgi:hypothetical protein
VQAGAELIIFSSLALISGMMTIVLLRNVNKVSGKESVGCSLAPASDASR